MADEKVDREKGTGIVMCATFGDTTDLEWFGLHGLPYKKVIDADGRISRYIPDVGGMRIGEARQRLISLLDENGLLIRSEKIKHTVAVHERCGKEIEILPSRQWFIEILSQKERFLAAADEINWYPASMKAKYTMWVKNLKWNWCISRQRYFGVPFPVWYCKSCGKPVFAEESKLPVNPLESLPECRCECGCAELIPETAVMDTWATSSLTPFINACSGESGERHIFPMSMRTQAHEIIRTWAFYSIVRSIYETGRVPWKDVMICGFVLAKKGEKLSKSKGNAVISPNELIERYSADILRYWAAGANLGTDTLFSQDELKIGGRFITKLWNAAKFALDRIEHYHGEKPGHPAPADCWILERCARTTAHAADLLNRYEIGMARHEVDELFWKDFCDTYLELAKERLYDSEAGEGHLSSLYAVYYGFLSILKLYSPFVPHITEFIYQNGYRRLEHTVSIHLTGWDTRGAGNSRTEFGDILKQILFETRKYKSEKNLSLKSEIDVLSLTVPESCQGAVVQAVSDIKSCCVCKKVIITAADRVSIRIVNDSSLLEP